MPIRTKAKTDMFMKLKTASRMLATVLVIGSPLGASAQQMSANGSVVVEQPWARASLGAARPGAAYLLVRNEGEDAISLVGLRAAISGMASVHETRTNSDGVSSMMPADDIEIPAGESIALEPGGYHAMLMQLQSPLVEGETFPLTLMFSDGTELDVTVPVLGFGARGPDG